MRFNAFIGEFEYLDISSVLPYHLESIRNRRALLEEQREWERLETQKWDTPTSGKGDAMTRTVPGSYGTGKRR
jgi:hypothetical protein